MGDFTPRQGRRGWASMENAMVAPGTATRFLVLRNHTLIKHCSIHSNKKGADHSAPFSFQQRSVGMRLARFGRVAAFLLGRRFFR